MNCLKWDRRQSNNRKYEKVKLHNQMNTNSFFTHLACSECGRMFDKKTIQTFCPDCKKPLSAIYAIPSGGIDKSILLDRPKTMWRYREMLPVENDDNIITLGEGFTPLLKMEHLGLKIGLVNLFLKDESSNPTSSFKARGLSMAVSKAKEFGISAVAIPTAGNAGSAMSAYAAKANMEAHVFMPKATPSVFKMDCTYFGAKVRIIEGSIRDCAKALAAQNMEKTANGQAFCPWFDVSTLKEPYRLEGKKTMGYEIAEQLDWRLPDVVIYPAGGGTGLIGIWKAFQEMMQLGWITHIPTRMVCVQAEGCSPIVDAFERGFEDALPVENPDETIANGLRVPSPFGDKWMLKVLKDSRGTVIRISDKEMLEGIHEMAHTEGVFVAPEGAATWIALKKLLADGWILPHQSVVLLNTGSAYKYIENLEAFV